jgi:hypothetical protein
MVRAALGKSDTTAAPRSDLRSDARIGSGAVINGFEDEA